jgi:hypothetical protein
VYPTNGVHVWWCMSFTTKKNLRIHVSLTHKASSKKWIVVKYFCVILQPFDA